MARDLLNKYLWIIDTVRRHKSISRSRLDELWRRSSISNGDALCRRTFYNYRNAIDEIFKISIQHNPATHEYFIAEDDSSDGSHRGSVLDWMLSSVKLSNVLADMQDVSDRVFLEDVPSARQFLSVVVDALRTYHRLRFTYHPYSRSKPTGDVVVEPYFLKIFRQRWYVTGLNPVDRKIKTYALDRMTDVSIDPEGTFVPQPGFDAEEYVRDAFGIVFSEGVVHRVVLRVNSRRAKYLRALPLHPSQEEAVHDTYSIITYRLRVTPDFVQELLSYGPDITVLEPPELRAMIIQSLNESLENYSRK